MIKTTVSGVDEALAELRKEIEAFMTDEVITVGVHEDEGMHDGAGINNAQLGATLNFGATINSPGGTSYGYATESDAEAGNVRFLKRGTGFMVLGVTKPHVIKIPARPWLEPGVEAGHAEYTDAIEHGIKSGQDLATILNTVGVLAVSNVQQFMTQLRTPPNTTGTIKRKGSSNPLIDTGELKSSVNYKITAKLPTEGL